MNFDQTLVQAFFNQLLILPNSGFGLQHLHFRNYEATKKFGLQIDVSTAVGGVINITLVQLQNASTIRITGRLPANVNIICPTNITKLFYVILDLLPSNFTFSLTVGDQTYTATPFNQDSYVAFTDLTNVDPSNPTFNFPPWTKVRTDIGVVNSNVADNLVDTTELGLNVVANNYIVLGTLKGVITGIHDKKYIRMCVGEDDTQSLLVEFPVNTIGPFEKRFILCIKTGGTQVSTSECDINNQARKFVGRGLVARDIVNLGASLQTRMWVLNNLDSFTVDSLSWQQLKSFGA